MAKSRNSTEQRDYFENSNLLGPSSGNSDISTAINELGQLPRPPCILDGLSPSLLCPPLTLISTPPADLPGPAILLTVVKLPLLQQACVHIFPLLNFCNLEFDATAMSPEEHRSTLQALGGDELYE